MHKLNIVLEALRTSSYKADMFQAYTYIATYSQTTHLSQKAMLLWANIFLSINIVVAKSVQDVLRPITCKANALTTVRPMSRYSLILNRTRFGCQRQLCLGTDFSLALSNSSIPTPRYGNAGQTAVKHCLDNRFQCKSS